MSCHSPTIEKADAEIGMLARGMALKITEAKLVITAIASRRFRLGRTAGNWFPRGWLAGGNPSSQASALV